LRECWKLHSLFVSLGQERNNQSQSKIKVMLVRDLILQLKKLDENQEVVFHSYIESGRGGSWIEVEYVNIEQHEDLENTIKISISGNEDEDGGYD